MFRNDQRRKGFQNLYFGAQEQSDSDSMNECQIIEENLGQRGTIIGNQNKIDGLSKQH